MAFNISTFKSLALPTGGARPSLFQVTLADPPGIPLAAKTKFTFTCRAAQLPQSSVGTIEIPYFGRKIKIAGDRVFQNWQVTVMNDEDFSVRDMMEAWSNHLNTHETNIRRTPTENSYKSEMEVIQFGKGGPSGDSAIPIRTYKLIGAFPTVVSPIALDWNTTDQIETFDVTFEYDYWLPVTTASGASTSYTGLEAGAGGGGAFGGPR